MQGATQVSGGTFEWDGSAGDDKTCDVADGGGSVDDELRPPDSSDERSPYASVARLIKAEWPSAHIGGPNTMALDSLWKNGTVTRAYWLWRTLKK